MTGTMGNLGRVMAVVVFKRRAADEMRISDWSSDGCSSDLRLAINVSRRQLDHASFFRGLRQAMHAAGAPARLLELEITETLAMHCSDDVLAAIGELRADGALVAFDDFGTSYLNLARLKVLPTARIKLAPSTSHHICEPTHATPSATRGCRLHTDHRLPRGS